MGTSLRDLMAQAKRPPSLKDLMAQAKAPPDEDAPSLATRLGADRWRDVGRGVANAAAGLLTAPAEGVARVVGQALPKRRGLTDVVTEQEGSNWALRAADALRAQREAVAAAVGPYETGTGAAAQLVGNLATAVAGGDPLATAAAAASPDASSLALVGDLLRRAGGKGGVAEQAADRIAQMAESPVTRAAVEYALGRATAGVASKVAARIRARRAALERTARPDGRVAFETDPARLLTDGTQPTPLPQMADGSPIGPAVPMPGVTVGEPGPVTGPAILARGELAPPPEGVRGVPSGARDRRTMPEIRQAADRAARAERSARLFPAESPVLGEPPLPPPPPIEVVTPPYRTRSAADQAALDRLLQPARGRGRRRTGDLTDPGRMNVFPGGPALAAVAGRPVVTSGIGATIGAVNNEDDRTSGAIVGGVGGYLFGVGVRGVQQHRALRAMNGSPAMASATPQARAAYGVLAAGIDLTGDLERAARAKAKGGWADRLRMWYDKAGDATRPLDRFSDAAVAAGLEFDLSPSAALNKALDAQSTQHRFIFGKAIDPMTGADIGPSFRDIHEPLAGSPGAIRDAWVYAVGKRITDRGIDAFSGDPAVFASYVDATQHLGQNPANLAFADRLNAYVDALGQYAVASGLWTPSEWAAMRAADDLYVPFRDVEAKVQREMGLSGRGGGRGGSLNVKGGARRYGNPEPSPTIANPAQSLIEHTKQIIRRADQARLNRALFAAADAMGPESSAILTMLPDSDPRILHAQQATALLQAQGLTPTQAAARAQLYVDKISGVNDVIEAVDEVGRRRYALLNAPEIRAALSAMRETPGQALSPELMRVLSLPRRIITATTTGLAPRFSLMKNPLMDIPDVAARVPGLRPRDLLRGYAASLRQSLYTHLQEAAPALAQRVGPSALADEAARAGLSNTSLFQRDLSPGAVQRQLAPTTPLQGAVAGVQRALSEPLALAESVGAAFDMGPRLAAYAAVRRQLLNAGANVVPARAQAAAVGARAAVDYRRTSSLRALQFLYQVIPFAKASVLATQRTLSFAKQYPERAATLASGAAMLGMLEWAANADDATMTDRPTTERVQGPQFRVGDQVWQLPMAPELNVFRTTTYAALDQLMRDDPYAGKLLKESLARALPPGFGEAIASGRPITSFMPPIAKELLEVDANRTVFGDRPVVPGPLQGLEPGMQRFPSTAPTWDALAAGLRESGIAPSASPLQVEHVLGALTNGFTPAALSLTDPIAERFVDTETKGRVPPPSITSSLNPLSAVVKRGTPTRTESEAEFYEIRGELAQRAKSARQLAAAAEKADPADRPARIAEARAYLAEHAAALDPAVQALPREMAEALRDFKAEEDAVQQRYRQKAIGRDAANAALDDIRSRRQALMRQATTFLRQRLGRQP